MGGKGPHLTGRHFIAQLLPKYGQELASGKPKVLYFVSPRPIGNPRFQFLAKNGSVFFPMGHRKNSKWEGREWEEKEKFS